MLLLVVIGLAIVIIVLLAQTTGLGGGVGNDGYLRAILRATFMAVHGTAVAVVPGKGENAVPGALSHVHDVLTESVLWVGEWAVNVLR